jgi:hypothetical protein
MACIVLQVEVIVIGSATWKHHTDTPPLNGSINLICINAIDKNSTKLATYTAYMIFIAQCATSTSGPNYRPSQLK